MKDIKVSGIVKQFGRVTAVDHVSFEVKAGELLTLRGPSGCGKTTTLRIIAGLERADRGEVYLGDTLLSSAERAFHLPPEKRGIGMVFQTYALRPHMTVSGRGYKAKPLELGRWRWATFGAIAGFFLVFGVLPFAILAVNSFMRVSGFFNPDLITPRHWDVVLHRASLIDSIRNTLIVGVGAATLGVISCALLSYTVTRTRWKGRRLLDVIAWIPWAVPGIVIALGFLWAFVSLPIYGTLWLLVLVYVARGFPIGSRFFTSMMVQVGNELEESSRIHGASWTRTFIHIWLPLLRPAVIGAWILLFVISVRVLDSALLLAGPTTRVLSVDIFQLQTTGRAEQASVLAIIQTGIISVGYVMSRLLLRGPQRPSV
jgi:iron(III) transport system permease protein